MERYSPAELDGLIRHTVDWLFTQRSLLRKDAKGDARNFSWNEQRELVPYFGADNLNTVKIRPVESVIIPGTIRGLLPDELDEFTFLDTLAVNDLDIHTLFRGTIRVVQFSFLKPEGYVEQFITGGEKVNFVYEDNPLEIQAKELADRFIFKGPQIRTTFNAIREVEMGLIKMADPKI